jgi:endonuclease YncB( thermonuclease family)
MAVARLYWFDKRTNPGLPFSRQIDLGAYLIGSGQARLASVDEGLVLHDGVASEKLSDKERDITYMNHLEALERKAISQRRGMWVFDHIRQSEQDLVDEVEWESTATWWQKLFRQVWR